MNWKRVLAGAACVLTMDVGAAHAQRITDPDWASRPDGDEVAEAYPKLALELGIEGRSTLSCTVSTEGRLRNCVSIATTPSGLGFDGAALKLAESFRMTPKMENGRPRPGSVNIPIRFVLPEDARLGASAAPHIGTPTSPGAAALAAQLAPILARDIIAGNDATVETALEQTTEGVDGQTKADARRALNDGSRAAAPAWGASLANAYASTMTERELQATLEYLSSPAGQAIEARQMQVLMAQAPSQMQFIINTSTQARDKLCAQVACGLDRWQAPEGVALVNPPWSRQPAEHDIENIAPPMTTLLGLPGWAQINCIALPSGSLDSCVAVRESPEGLHFGAAALQLSDGYVIDSARVGKNITGETVAVLINFKPTNFAALTSNPPPNDEPHAKVPSDEAMSWARRIVETEVAMLQINSMADQLEIPSSIPSSGNPELLGAKAFVGAVQENRAALVEQMARPYAVEYTPAELQVILDFRIGPGGQGLIRLDPNLIDALERFHGAKAAAEARRRFCAGRDCDPAKAAP